MMKRILLTATMLLLFCLGVAAQTAATTQDYGLPSLHVIKAVTLSPSYSCRSTEDFQKGYEGTALFLSAFSKRRNSPELLFNGACKSDNYFGSHGLSFLADLGPELLLEKLSAQDVLHIYQMRSQPGFPLAKHAQSAAALARSVKVVPGHTYAVFLNTGEVHGLFVFTVTNYVPDKSVEIKYAVKDYQITMVRAQSPGFSWDQENAPAPETAPAEKTATSNRPN